MYAFSMIAEPDERAKGLERMRAWARGAEAGKRLDRDRWRRMSPRERVDEGLALVRIAEKLRAGR